MCLPKFQAILLLLKNQHCIVLLKIHTNSNYLFVKPGNKYTQPNAKCVKYYKRKKLNILSYLLYVDERSEEVRLV